MIISCNCGVRLKIGDEKLTDAGVKIKCPKCGTVHMAVKPRPEGAASGGGAVSSFAPAAPRSAAPADSGRGPLVLIAHDSEVVADMINGVLKSAGMTTQHAVNGLEALKMATDLKPQAMVVDVGLTGIYGFELCERLKGDPDTKGIKIILLSSVYGLTAYKRSPVNLYGADDYIEKHHIPDKLVPKLQQLIHGEEGVPGPVPSEGTRSQPFVPSEKPKEFPQKQQAPAEPMLDIPEAPSVLPTTPVTLSTPRKRSESVTSSSRAGASPTPAPMAAPSAPVVPARKAAPEPEIPDFREGSSTPADASVRLDASFFEHEEYDAPAAATPKEAADPAEIEKAKRFARIIVSDIVLYNQETVAEGVRDGSFYDLLKDDIAEGRAVYAQRVPEAVRKGRDYLQEALDDFLASKKKHR